MPNYRIYFLDVADHVAASHLIDCDTDSQAQTRADRLLAASHHAGIEGWDRGRHVYRVDKVRPTGAD